MEKSPKSQAGYWSTCAYLINKAVMAPILDQIWTVSKYFLLPYGTRDSLKMSTTLKQNFVRYHRNTHSSTSIYIRTMLLSLL